MTNLSKEFIEKLSRQNSDYTSPESAQNLANSLESLSTDIYTDSQRFVYELLQNADDASSACGNLELAINIVDNYLVVSHNGEPFTQVDIESVCSVGDGNKRGDANKTGFKGIGFKSVFSHSDLVIINSGNYCFRFDKEYWDGYWKDNWGSREDWETERTRKQKQKNIKMPWQIIPIWTDLPQELITTRNFKVSTIIRCRATEKLQKDLFELFSNTQILLFLRSNQIEITISNSKNRLTFSIEKVTQNGVVILKKNSQKVSEWLLRIFEIDVDDSIKILMENDVRIPQKLRESNKTELSFAVQIENDQIKTPEKESSLIFTYLPTSVNCGFPFLVNASFLTDAGRQHLHEDLPWNIWLFRKMPIMLFIWLSELAESEYKNQILKLIPYEFYSHSSLKSSFNSGLKIAINEIAFIPNEEGQLLKVCEAIFDKTKISDFVGRKVLVNYINSINNTHFDESAFIPYLKPIHTLEKLGLMIFDIDSLEFFLTSTTFQDNHHIEQNFDLISYLYQQSEHHLSGQEKEDWIYTLKSIPFIFDQLGNLKTSQQIYFPAIEFSNDFDEDAISIIHSEVMLQIESSRDIKNWLEILGVKEPTDITFIEKTIILDENYITIENAIKVGRYLFTAHKKGLLTDNLYINLKQISLLSTENKLIVAQYAYLSEFYEPQFSIDKFLRGNIFVSIGYFSQEDLRSEWKSFLLKIGVSETIQLQKNVDKKESKTIESEYFDFVYEEAKEKDSRSKAYPRLFNRNNLVGFDSITFLKFANIYTFSKIFWAQVFKFVDLKNIQAHAILEWGHCGAASSCLVKNYIYWAIENLEIIPTTMGKCFNGKNVFTNNKEIKEIGGKYIPIFDCEGVIPQNWLEYLPFKSSLKLDDYLDILSSISYERVNDQDLLKENQRRINLIYKKLAEDYLGYSEHLEQWAKKNNILSRNGRSFFNPSELSVITVEGFKGQKLAFCDERNEKVIELLKIFGVSVITEINLDVHGQVERQDLKKKIKEVLPLIAVVSVEKSNNKKDWQTEYSRLDHKLIEASFFEAREIYLSYDNLEEKQPRSSWAKDNYFYYIGEWKKPRVLDGIVETLGKFLGIRHEERHLSILLSDTFEEGIIYLKEKFGDIVLDLIPSEYYPLESVDPVTSDKSLSIAISNDDGVSEEELAIEYGMKGVDLAKKFYTYLGYKVNQSSEAGYDLLCHKDNDFIKVEVKAITFSRPNIRLTQQEWGQMMNSSNIHSYEIFVFSHNQGNLHELIRCKEAWLTLQSVFTKLHSQSKSDYYYGSNEVELLLGLQLNQSKSGNDVIINWHRLIKNSNQKSIEKYKYDETMSIFVKTD
jgi:hypothetical protein